MIPKTYKGYKIDYEFTEGEHTAKVYPPGSNGKYIYFWQRAYKGGTKSSLWRQVKNFINGRIADTEQPRWIPVSETLPDDNRTVLIRDEIGIGKGRWNQKLYKVLPDLSTEELPGEWRTESLSSEIPYHLDPEDITHWMDIESLLNLNQPV